MKYGGKYWNIKELLPYQRNFNFVNSIRSTGKTYTTAGFLLDRFMAKQEESLLLVRTIDEKKQGALYKWFDKALSMEFDSLPVTFTSDALYYTPEKDKSTWRIICHCRALSEAVKVKKQSFPRVKWMVFDEYMLEAKHQDLYVKGWREPDLLLNIYHTVDREEDRVKCFLLGNNTSFYNPYHLHPAFQIPPTPPGKIWYSENVLFQWYEPSEELLESKKKNKFLRMIEGTDYGEYAKEGRYIGDNENFIKEKTSRANFVFSFKFDSTTFHVWFDYRSDSVFISFKGIASSNVCLSLDEMGEERDIRVTKRHSLIKWLAKKYSFGRVFYENMECKLKAETVIQRRII